MRTSISPASRSISGPLRVAVAPWATAGAGPARRPPGAPHRSHLFLADLFLGPCLRVLAGRPPRWPPLKTARSRFLLSLSAWRSGAGPPAFYGTTIRLCVCWKPIGKALPHWAGCLKSLALPCGVAIGQNEKICLSLLPIYGIAFCLVALVHLKALEPSGGQNKTPTPKGVGSPRHTAVSRTLTVPQNLTFDRRPWGTRCYG